jgi:hypothetical protein
MSAQQLELPLARNSDPVASHLAAAQVSLANGLLHEAIRTVVRMGGPMTQEQICAWVGKTYPLRWKPETIRTACAPRRSRLRLVGHRQIDGRTFGLYDL